MSATLIGMGVAGLGSLYSSYKQGQLAQKNMRYLDKQRSRLDNMFNKKYHQDVFESDASKSALKKLQEQMRDSQRQERSSSAITGASDEAKTASKGKRLKAYSNAITTMAEDGARRKERLFDNYHNASNGLDRQYMDINNGKINSWSNLTNNLWNTSSAVTAADGVGAFSKDKAK